MDSNDDFYGKQLNLNCFYMHTNFGQKYLKTAIVLCGEKNIYHSPDDLSSLKDIEVKRKKKISTS